MNKLSPKKVCICGVLLLFLSMVGFSEECEATLQEQLSAITLDAFDCRGATVQDVVAHLQKYLPPQVKNEPILRITFEVLPAPDSAAETETRITLARRNISMLDAIKAVKEHGHLSIRFDEDSVVLVSSNPHDENQGTKGSEQGDPTDAKVEWDITQMPLRMQVAAKVPFGSGVDATTTQILPDSFPLMLSIQILPSPEFKRYRRQALAAVEVIPREEERPAQLTTVSYARKDGAKPLAVTVLKRVGDIWEPFVFPDGEWVVGGGGQDLSQAYATRLQLLHTSYFPRRLPQGRYQITVSCQLKIETGLDAKQVEIEGDAMLDVAAGDAFGASQSCAISWLQCMLELSAAEADSKLQEELSVKLDEWLQLWGAMNGTGSIRHAKTIGLLAAQLNRYEVAFDYLLKYLLVPHENQERAYTAARHVFNRLCEDMGRENPLVGIGYK